MTTLPLIKTGSLVFIKVWPVPQLYLANGRPHNSAASPTFTGWERFEAYGYQEIAHFFSDADGMQRNIQSANGELPLGGLVIESSGFEVRKKMAKYSISRFYRILAEGSEKPLWFPESDVTVMTPKTYEALKKKYEK